MVATGGVHGCWGVCMVALGGHAWLLGGACMVALGGRAWFLWGSMRCCSGGMCGCSGGHAWLLWGGMHGCSGGMRGCSGGHVWDTTRYGDTVNERAVRILLECILVIAGSLESANSSILAARRLFKDFGGEKIRIL